MTWVTDDNLAFLTDFYEITMAQAYVATGADGPATFDLFVRRLPEHRRFLVAAGLEQALDGLTRFRFNARLRDYLAGLSMFTDEFLGYLADFRFVGDVWAVPEGEVVFPTEPIVRVTAPLPAAQLVETFLLNTIGFQTMIASKAARVALACRDRRFVDFSARRDHGADAALKGARAAFVGGAAATSMTLAGLEYGIPVSGTMAHSFVMSYPREIDAFRDFARLFPDDAVLLIDTYDTEEGARRAAAVATELAREGIDVRGVRLDSGDLSRLARAVRRILDDAGGGGVQIFVSGDLDEWQIAEMVGGGVPVDAFGVGTRLGTSTDAPYLGVVYKLVQDDDGPVMKLSSGKLTLPGRKQAHRRDGHDVLALDGEEVEGGRPLLHQVMHNGDRTHSPEPLDVIRDRREAAVAALPSRLRTLTGEEAPYEVQLSDGLQALTAQVRTDLGS